MRIKDIVLEPYSWYMYPYMPRIYIYLEVCSRYMNRKYTYDIVLCYIHGISILCITAIYFEVFLRYISHNLRYLRYTFRATSFSTRGQPRKSSITVRVKGAERSPNWKDFWQKCICYIYPRKSFSSEIFTDKPPS